jgi:vitamin B12/bleomycin/antimicrobial peptide transport system ATP-binding/permease protein
MSFPGAAWRLAAPYWRSEERWRARLLLILIVALTLGLVFILVLINDWNRQFYEALQNYDFAAFGPLLLRFAVLASLYIIGAVYKLYFTQMLEMRWRIWLTRRFLSTWLDNRVYYQLELDPRGTDNPDQRIADDLRLFTASTLELSLGLLSSVVTLVSFVAILWGVSGALSVSLGSVELVIPGYMVWAALLYAFFGSALARVIGRPLIGLNFQQQRVEADFRFGLVRIRENAEGIALYRGESFEDAQLQTRFERIRANWWALMNATKRLTFFTVGYNQAAVIFPMLVAAPRYFSGAITLGVLVQIANAFGQVQGALSWFVDSYGALAGWKASTDRLLTFDSSIRQATAIARRPELTIVANTRDALQAEALDLRLPNGKLVLANGAFSIAAGERVLLNGPNGSGKSVLFRAIAGIWPFGHGRIYAPLSRRQLFLPQRPYLPIATLREAVSYPARAGTFDDEAIRAALHAVGLERFAQRLDEVQNWTMQMSGGEQQRLAIARALLHHPEWLFLDEATSALDEAGERDLYALLGERLANSSIFSIAHRSQAVEYHETRLLLAAPADGGPARLLVCPGGEPGRPARIREPITRGRYGSPKTHRQ